MPADRPGTLVIEHGNVIRSKAGKLSRFSLDEIETKLTEAWAKLRLEVIRGRTTTTPGRKMMIAPNLNFARKEERDIVIIRPWCY